MNLDNLQPHLTLHNQLSDELRDRIASLLYRSMEYMSEAILIQDKDSGVVLHNRAALQLLAPESDSLIGLHFGRWPFRIVDQFGNPANPRQLPSYRALESREPIGPVTFGLERDNSPTTWVRVSAYPMETPEGDLVLSIFNDRTDLVLANLNDSISRSRFDALMAASSDIVALHDLSGRFIEVSGSITTILGFERDEILGKSLEAFTVPPSFLREINAKMRSAIINDHPITFTFPIETKLGETVWLETTARSVRQPCSQRADVVVAISRVVTDRISESLKLDEALRDYRRLADHTPGVFLLLIDRDLSIKMAAGPEIKRLCWTSDKLEGAHIREILRSDQVEQVETSLHRALAGITSESTTTSDDGHHYNLSFVTVPAEEPQENLALLVASDITVQESALAELRYSQAVLETVFSYSAVAMARMSANGKIFAANQTYCSLLGRTIEEILHTPWETYVFPDDVVQLYSFLLDANQSTQNSAELAIRMLHHNGSELSVRLVMTIVRDDSGRPHEYLGQCFDITNEISSIRDLSALAGEDPLTKISNRRGFLIALDQSLSKTPIDLELGVLLMMDLDHFKWVNDTYGHQKGDELLQALAHDWRARLRSQDLFGRLGGDEFVAFLYHLEEPNGVHVANDLIELCRKRAELMGAPQVSCSVGLVLSRGGQSATSLIDSADRALYDAKRLGRGKVVVAHEADSPHH